MKLALDTNRYSDLIRGDADVAAVIEAASEVCIPVIVLGELRAGFKRGVQEAQNEAKLRAFLAKPNVRVLYPDDATSVLYGTFEAELRTRGMAIPTNDVWIAALAVQHGLMLFTRDQHFRHLPRVAVV